MVFVYLEQNKKKSWRILMNNFKKVSKILDETMNCSAGINAYESLPTRTKDYENKKKNWDKMIKGVGPKKD